MNYGVGGSDWKSGSTLQSLTALSDGEAEFYAVVKGGQVGLSLMSTCMCLGIPIEVEIHSDCSKANSLTDRLGARPRTKHIDTHVLFGTRTSSRRRSQHQEGAHSENLCRCWNDASLCFCSTTTLQVCRIGIVLTMDPTLRDVPGIAHLLTRADVGDAEQTIVITGCEHRDWCKSGMKPLERWKS